MPRPIPAPRPCPQPRASAGADAIARVARVAAIKANFFIISPFMFTTRKRGSRVKVASAMTETTLGHSRSGLFVYTADNCSYSSGMLVDDDEVFSSNQILVAPIAVQHLGGLRRQVGELGLARDGSSHHHLEVRSINFGLRLGTEDSPQFVALRLCQRYGLRTLLDVARSSAGRVFVAGRIVLRDGALGFALSRHASPDRRGGGSVVRTR